MMRVDVKNELRTQRSRIMKGAIIFLAAFLFSQKVSSLTITFDGAACSNDSPIGEEPVRTSSETIRSTIEVIEHINDVMYRLRLHGGMPWYDAETSCIDETAFGVDNIFLEISPEKLESIDVVGVFSGNKLAFTFNSIHTTNDAALEGNGVDSSFFTIKTNTYIFNYNDQDNVLILSNMAFARNSIYSFGEFDLAGNIRIYESIVSAAHIQFKPPNQNIRYVIEP